MTYLIGWQISLMMARCNVMQFPSLFSQIFLLHHLSPFPVTLKTTKACPSGVPPRSSGEEKLNELLHEVPGDGPDSAGSTAVVGTVLREMQRSFAVLLGSEGANHEFSLLNWAGLCFYCYRCASAAPRAIWALWEWIWCLIQVQEPQNKIISMSILISPSCTARSIPVWIDVHDMQQWFVLHANIDFSSFWFIMEMLSCLEKLSCKKILPVVFFGDPQSSWLYRATRPLVGL